MTTRNHRTREGFEWRDKFCAIKKFSFIKGGDAILAIEDKTGNWIKEDSASELVDYMQYEINKLAAENKALKRRSKIKGVSV